MGIFDRTARRAAHEEPLALVSRFAALAEMNVVFVDWKDTRMTPKTEERDQTADHVLVLRDKDSAKNLWLSVVEFQAADDPEKLDDIQVEASQLRRNQRDNTGQKYLVLPAFVYLKDTPAVEGFEMVTKAGFGVANVPLFWVLKRDKASEWLDAFEQGKITHGILFWIACMSGADDPAIVARWLDLVVRLVDAKHRDSLISTALIFAELNGIAQTWSSITEAVVQTESQIVNKWIDNAHSQGQLATRRGDVLAVLAKRFKGADLTEISKVVNTNPNIDVLGGWLEEAAVTASIADFVAFLRR